MLAGLFMFMAWGTSANPWGYISEAGAFSQGLFVVGFLQLCEAMIVLRKLGPWLSRKPKPAPQ